MSVPPDNDFTFQPETYPLPEEFDDTYTHKLRQYFNDIAIALNIKENGFYNTQEIATGGLFLPIYTPGGSQNFTNRALYRKTIDTGALPNTGTTNTPHGITVDANFSLVHLYGGATKPTAPFASIPLNHSSPILSENISLKIDDTNVIITTGDNRAAYTRSFVVIEYIKEV